MTTSTGLLGILGLLAIGCVVEAESVETPVAPIGTVDERPSDVAPVTPVMPDVTNVYATPSTDLCCGWSSLDECACWERGANEACWLHTCEPVPACPTGMTRGDAPVRDVALVAVDTREDAPAGAGATLLLGQANAIEIGVWEPVDGLWQRVLVRGLVRVTSTGTTYRCRPGACDVVDPDQYPADRCWGTCAVEAFGVSCDWRETVTP